MSAPSPYGHFMQQWFGPDVRVVPAGGITPDERRNFRVEAIHAAADLHGDSQDDLSDADLERVLAAAERIYEWIIAPPDVPAGAVAELDAAAEDDR